MVLGSVGRGYCKKMRTVLEFLAKNFVKVASVPLKDIKSTFSSKI